jgi:hypothetical protein
MSEMIGGATSHELERAIEGDRLFTLPFDQYQRYRDVKEVVDAIRSASQSLRILDVGGGEAKYLPAPDFFPDDLVLVADLHALKLPHYVQASGTQLPFDDDTFDVAFSCDTLEHLRPEDREKFVSELFRVSRGFVILVAPFHTTLAELAEQVVQRAYIAECGEPNKALLEHEENGLPRLEQTEAIFKSLSAAQLRFPSGNIHNWVIMNSIAFAFGSLSVDLYRDANRVYNRCFYDRDHCPPAYRHCLVAAKTKHCLRQFDRVQTRLADWIAFEDPRSNSSNDSVQPPTDFPIVETWLRALHSLKEVIRDRDAHARNLEESLGNVNRAAQELTAVVQLREAQQRDSDAQLKEAAAQIVSLDREKQDLQKRWTDTCSSNGWRALQRYYSVRDRILPSGSKRRRMMILFWRLATRQPLSERRWRDL